MRADTRLPPYLPYPRFLPQTALTQTAKLLYALLLDRATLSQSNGWLDEGGRIYLVFSIEKIAAALDRSPMIVKTALSELEDAGLIERRRSGFSLTIFTRAGSISPHDDASLSSLPYAPIISYFPKHTVIVKGSRCIAALDVGGKNGNKLRRKRLPLQGILRNGSQRFSFRFPYPVYCNAGAVFHVENAGVIVSGNCRVQPPFSKWRPDRLPGRQVDSIRTMKKARVFRRKAKPAQKPVYIPNLHGSLRHLSAFDFFNFLPQGR